MLLSDKAKIFSRRARPRASWLLIVLFIVMLMGLLTSFELLHFELLQSDFSYLNDYAMNYYTVDTNWVPAILEQPSSSSSLEQQDSVAFNDPSHSSRLSLDELLAVASVLAPITSCPEGTQYVGRPKKLDHQTAAAAAAAARTITRIPKIIHQTDISSCLSPDYIKIIDPWRNLTDFEYYFHTKESMDALIRQDWPEFPHLASIIQCISNHQGYVDLWKALVLYEFGGAAIEFDLLPIDILTETMIQPQDEAIVLSKEGRPYPHGIFMERRHPLAYYMVMHILNGINVHRELATAIWSKVTSYPALDNAWMWFSLVDKNIVDENNRYRAPEDGYALGEYPGRYNRTARLVDYLNYTKMGTLGGNWRPLHYPKMKDRAKWNVTCMSVTHDYLVSLAPP